MAQDGGATGVTFHGEMDRSLQRKLGLDYNYGMHYNSLPERDGKDQDRIAQSKRVRAGSLATIVD